MPVDIPTLGTQALGGALGLGLGAIGGTIQGMQQENLMNSQRQQQQQLSAYNEQLQEKLWKATGPVGMVSQLEQAGLNPALYYGGGGGGGSTALAQGSLSGGQAQNQAGLGVQMSEQLGLMQAQKENIQADTAKKQAEVPQAQAQTQSLLQGIQNQKAQLLLTQADTKIANLQVKFDTDTMTDREGVVQQTLAQITQTAQSMKDQRLVDDATIQTKISILKRDLANKVLEGALTQAQTDATKQSIQESMQKIKSMWSATQTDWERLSNENKMVQLKDMEQDWEQSGLPKGLQDILHGIFFIPGLGTGSKAPIGFKVGGK